MHNGNILIVDDDPMIRDVLRDVLSNMGGYKIDAAQNGRDGLKKIRDCEYDIIFTDLTMPQVNGMDLLKEAKKINSSIPVVVITGYSSIEHAVNAMKEGASDFITKPFKIGSVIELTRRIIGEKKLLNDIAIKDDHRASMERLNAELFNKLQEISIFQSLSSELDGLYSNSEIYKRITGMSSGLLAVRESSFGIIENGFLKIKSAVGMTKKDVPIAGTFFEKVIKSKNYHMASFGEMNPYDGKLIEFPFLSIPLMINDEIFGILNVSSKADGSAFTEDEISLALNFAKKAALRIENNALYDILYNNLVNALRSLVITIEARDPYTRHHSERVTDYSLQIAEVMNLSEEDKDVIRFGGYLHDIGKIGVRDTVLLKPGRLSGEEIEEIRQHTVIGDNIMEPLTFFQKEKPLIRNHHERFDGKGYPDGIGGLQIPLIVRILAVADSYDAMTSSRPYRTARSYEYAIQEMKSCSHTQFDAEVVRAFLTTPAVKSRKHES